MAEQSEQAKPAQKVTPQERRQIATRFGAAILTRQSGRTPAALAREVVDLTDAFIAELEKKVN